MENKDLIVRDNKTFNEIAQYLPEHAPMIEMIEKSFPEINRASSLFYKTQSQFMDNLLTVSHPTPIRNLRQTLAEITRLKEALQEAHFKCMKKEIEIKIKQRDLGDSRDHLAKELMDVEIMELKSQIANIQNYASGAIRSIANYVEQYNEIMRSYGLQNFNEVDFEKEEEKYHIMKAFDQALIAARSRGGVIDEGNMIYFTQIGINGGVAQKSIIEYLTTEGVLLSEGKEPTFDMVVEFLNAMAVKFAGCSMKAAASKGMKYTLSENAALKSGDLRLIK